MIAPMLRRIELAPVPLFWGYLLLVTLAEYVTAAISPHVGLIMHAVILVILVLHASLTQSLEQRRFALALTLAPLIRMLSLSLPLPDFRQIYWYPLVSTPLLVTFWIIVRQTKITRSELRLKQGNLLLQCMLMVGGFGLGAIEYAILQPAPLIRPFEWWPIIQAAIILTIFTGFTEEVVFRGMLQSFASPLFGRIGLWYVALLFAVLHIGYLSLLDVIFVFCVGLIFGYIADWSGSIFGLSVAHGLTNVFLFLIMPYVAEDLSGQFGLITTWMAWGGSLLALISIAVMLWQRGMVARLRQAVPALAQPKPARIQPIPQLVAEPAPNPSRGQMPAPGFLVRMRSQMHKRFVPAAAKAQPVAGVLARLQKKSAASSIPVAVTHALPIFPERCDAGASAQCTAFYQQLTGSAATPLVHVHIAAQQPAELRALLFVPANRHNHTPVLQLYVNGQQIDPELLGLFSRYFAFVEGVVVINSMKLPVHLSPQTIQQMPEFYAIRRMLSLQLRRELDSLAQQEPDRFSHFWDVFGSFFGSEGASPSGTAVTGGVS
jgi:uncharacterized protein